MEKLTEQQLQLIDRAKAQYGEISYCGKAESWNECFTEDDGELCFWFNDSDGNTHMIPTPTP